MKRCDGLLAYAARAVVVVALLGLTMIARPGGRALPDPPASFWSNARLYIDRWFNESVDPWRQQWHDAAAGVDLAAGRVGALLRSAAWASLDALHVEEQAGGDDAAAKRGG